MKKIYLGTLTLIGILLFTANTGAQDPNFHIYLCFGQSNMEGQGTIEAQDKTVDPRFRVMEAVDCTNLGRVKGSWYEAVPPLTRCYSGLSPADYFGRTMVENLPDSITVGVINVSVAGCKIELFDRDHYQDYVAGIEEDWLINIINEYDGNPYARLVEMAQLAQQDGVIKGILLHQGEANTGDNEWPSKVKIVYNNLVEDLALNPDSVPLIAGEVVDAEQGGICASMNTIIARLPETLQNAYVVSSSGCTDQPDNLHFNSAGYRKIGTRYAIQRLALMDIEVTEPEEPEEPEGTEISFYEAECADIGDNWDLKPYYNASNGTYVMVKPGIQSINEPATGPEDLIKIPFKVDTSGTFNLYARLYCPNADDDSFWLKMDDGEFVMANGLGTSGWQWKNLNQYSLGKGDHLLTLSYREDGARLDKICISNFATAPEGFGDEALNICIPDTSTVGILNKEIHAGYKLEQNVPNPFGDITHISFEIPEKTFVSLKVYNMLGAEMDELAGKILPPGRHSITFSSGSYAKGLYLYTLRAGTFSTSQKMQLK